MAEKRKAIFLDKDGTIIPDVPYNVNPDLISLEAGVIEGLQLLKKNGYIFVVISNQAGVARGYFPIEALQQVEQKLNELLNPHDIEVVRYYFCPHHPQGTVPAYSIVCNCRKPNPGMLLRALDELDIDASQCWMIGDILNDVEAGNRSGCKTILIDRGNETEWVPGTFRTPTFVAANFEAAANYISNQSIEHSKLNDSKLAAL